MKDNVYTIDAAGKTLGRLASKVAFILMGKNKPNFLPHRLSNNKVIVYNLSKIKITGKKFDKKVYYRHSGYLGGIKTLSFKELFTKDKTLPFKKAVYRMLPKNKLREKMIKNLKLYAEEYTQ